VNEAATSIEQIETVELRIPSKPEWVAVARLAVAAIANRLPFSVEEIEDLKLAIAEACTTCITQSVGAETIDITSDAAPTYLRIRVRDHGFGERREPPPRPRAVPTADGLGIFLIQALMDTVEHKFDPQSGTELIMLKRLASD
jgi:serine/threonine-protein kinase RsbW